MLEEDEGPAPSEPTAKGGPLNSGKGKKDTKQARGKHLLRVSREPKTISDKVKF